MTRVRTKTNPDAKILKLNGDMGHKFVVIEDDGDGGRHVAGRCVTIELARYIQSEQAKRNPTIYHRAGGKWKTTA